MKFVDFENRVCLVTGAGSPTGIGFNTAKILGGLGDKIAIVATTDRIYERAEELKTEGIDAKGYIADLMDREQVKKLVAAVTEEFGQIDVLVNNAGMVQVGMEEDFSGFLDMTYESWDDAIDRNLNITFNVTKEVMPFMVDAGYGRIVNVSSVTGPVVSNPGEASYSAAKAGVVGLSRALAIEFQPELAVLFPLSPVALCLADCFFDSVDLRACHVSSFPWWRLPCAFVAIKYRRNIRTDRMPR